MGRPSNAARVERLRGELEKLRAAEPLTPRKKKRLANLERELAKVERALAGDAGAPAAPRAAPQGASPRAPRALPPNPGPRSAPPEDAAQEPEELEPEVLDEAPEPVGLTPEGLVEMTCELRSFTIVTLATFSKAKFDDDELAELIQTPPAVRARLLAFAPGVVPYVNQVLPNMGVISCGLFGLSVAMSMRAPLAEIKRRAPKKGAQPQPADAAAQPAPAPASSTGSPPQMDFRRGAAVESAMDAREPSAPVLPPAAEIGGFDPGP